MNLDLTLNQDETYVLKFWVGENGSNANPVNGAFRLEGEGKLVRLTLPQGVPPLLQLYESAGSGLLYVRPDGTHFDDPPAVHTLKSARVNAQSREAQTGFPAFLLKAAHP